MVLLGTVSLLAVLHMIAPDHWLPLMAVSSVRKFSGKKTFLISSLLGFIHAGTSIVVGIIALAIGILLVKNYLVLIYFVGIILLILIGIYFIFNGYFEADNLDKFKTSSIKTVLSISVLPDLALIPFIVMGVKLSLTQFVMILILFTVVSSSALPIVVIAASSGFSRIIEKVSPRYVDYMVGLILISTATIIWFY